MRKPARPEPIAEYATLRENEAAQRLAASAAQLRTMEQELEQLRGHVAEYRRRALHESTDDARVQDAREFLARLSNAVASHEAEMQRLLDRHRLEAERWRESHRRAQTLDKHVERTRRTTVQHRAEAAFIEHAALRASRR